MKLPTKHIFKLSVFIAIAAFPAISAWGQTDSLQIYVPDSTFFQRQMRVDSLRILEQAERENLENASQVKAVDTTSRFGFFLSVDYGKLLAIPTDFETKYEGSAGFILFRRFILEGTYGSAELNPSGAYKNAEYYTIEGQYYKGALSYKFTLNPNNPREFLYLGVGYAMSQYSDRGKFLIGSLLWDDFEESFSGNNMEASWTEVYLTTESYLNKNTRHFLVGAKISLRIMDDFETRENIPVYAVPGYGRTFDKTVPAINFYVKYSLPF